MTDESEGDKRRDGPSFDFLLVSLLLCCLLTACGSPSKYTPRPSIHLLVPSGPSSPNSLPLIVRMVKLVDVSPAEDKEDGWRYGSGWSMTSPERLNGALDVLLTEAVVGDFRTHGVFKDLVHDHQEEQLRLEGKIHKFYQRRGEYLWALCCGLIGALLPFPLTKEEGEVDLEFTLSQPDGSSIKSYRGRSSFLKRCNFYESQCMSNDSSAARDLDQAFGESMKQIRQGIIKDKDLITSRVLKQAL